MADNRLNKTGLRYLLSKMAGFFALQSDFSVLEDKVDELITEGGEPNVIEGVKVNGTKLTPDTNKDVDVTVPTKTSELTNDGSNGTDKYAVESIYDATLSVNQAPITNNYTALVKNRQNFNLSFEADDSNDLVKMGIGYETPGDPPTPHLKSLNIPTTDYVDANGGKIQKLKVDGTELQIDSSDKSVNIPVASSSAAGAMSASDKAKLDAVEAEAQKNVQSDWNQATTTADDFIKNKPTRLSDFTNDGDGTQGSTFPTMDEVDTAIESKMVGALKPKGSVTFANLPALTAANANTWYNVSDAFTSTEDFIEGAGISYPAGTNVAIINIGTEQNPVYKYDAMIGMVDLSDYWNTTNLPALTTAEIDDVWDSVFNPTP